MDTVPTRAYSFVARNVEIPVEPFSLPDGGSAVFPSMRLEAIAEVARERGAPAALVRTTALPESTQRQGLFSEYEYEVDLIR